MALPSMVCSTVVTFFRIGLLCSVLEWSRSVSNLWLTDLYGPVYYETNMLIMNGDTLKAWHQPVVSTHL